MLRITYKMRGCINPVNRYSKIAAFLEKRTGKMFVCEANRLTGKTYENRFQHPTNVKNCYYRNFPPTIRFDWNITTSNFLFVTPSRHTVSRFWSILRSYFTHFPSF